MSDIFIQIFKFLTDFVVNKKINLKRLMGAGGMPSSHSAVVCALSSSVGKIYGFDSGIFAISIIMAFVVMYDAAGVRRAAGKQASILNQLINSNQVHVDTNVKLKELLGHTPVQVIVGGVYGVIVGIIFML